MPIASDKARLDGRRSHQSLSPTCSENEMGRVTSWLAARPYERLRRKGAVLAKVMARPVAQKKTTQRR